MRAREFIFLALFGAFTFAAADPFQLIVTKTPPGNADPSNWQSVLRWSINGTGGTATPISDIPKTQVADPASPAFRSENELFIANRHGNGGTGSISRFEIDEMGNAVPTTTITGNGLSNVHQICFNPITGELFAANLTSGISRFLFDYDGVAIPHGNHSVGALRGIGVSRDGGNLYVTRASNEIARYRLNADGTITQLASLFPPGASGLHFIKFRFDGEMYAADILSNKVYRYRFNALNEPTYVGFVSSPSPIDAAFSPDGQEMYLSSHFDGGVRRYIYNSGSDSWAETATLTTPSLGGLATRQAIVALPGTIAGNVYLQNFIGDRTAVPVEIEIRDSVTHAVLETQTVSLDLAGNYSLTTNLRGSFVVAAKASHWLRKERPESFVLDDDKGATGVNVSIANGDCDDDNEVTLVDYGQLASSFGKSDGDPGFLPQTDLDGDGETTLVDFGVLAANFGLAGD